MKVDTPTRRQRPLGRPRASWWIALVLTACTTAAVPSATSSRDGSAAETEVTSTSLVTATVPEAGSTVPNVPAATTATSTLPDLWLPGAGLNEPAGEYGWTGALGASAGMHHYPDTGGQTQIVFAVENDCFGAGGDPVAMKAAGLDGLYVEPYEDPSVLFFSQGGETTGAYALPIGDRTLCVYLSWDPATTEEELAAGRQIVESIRGQPHGEDGIRINYTLPARWDIG